MSVREFTWAVVMTGGYHFTYLYGPRGECQRVAAREDGAMVHKGLCLSLAECQRKAEHAAAELNELYEGVGSARVMTTAEFLAQVLEKGTGTGAGSRGRGPGA